MRVAYGMSSADTEETIQARIGQSESVGDQIGHPNRAVDIILPDEARSNFRIARSCATED